MEMRRFFYLLTFIYGIAIIYFFCFINYNNNKIEHLIELNHQKNSDITDLKQNQDQIQKSINKILIKNDISTSPPTGLDIQTPRLKTSSTKPYFKLYLHPAPDMVSDSFSSRGFWFDCDPILKYVTSKLTNIKKLVIVEVGTNIGTCAFMYIANGHKVYGFEPFPPSVELIKKSQVENFDLPGELILINAGASNKKGISNVFFENGNIGNTRIGENKENYNIKQYHYQKFSQIRSTTIDSVVSEHVHLLKMDCQGYEYFAAMGANDLIINYGIDVVVFELTPIFIESNNQNPADLLHFFEERNFSIYHEEKEVLKQNFESFVKHIKSTRLDTTIVCYNKAIKFDK